MKWFLVKSENDVLIFLEEITKHPAVGIDTEYDSFRYFREKLCLIQISTGEKTFIFDPLGDLDLSFLGDIFYKKGIVKVVHAGDNDIRYLKRDYNFKFTSIFDTYHAASILGYRNLSLERLVQEVLGYEIKKNRRIQRSRWDLRPLKHHQIEYAVQDTVFLLPLYERLSEILVEKKLFKKAQNVFAAISDAEWQEKRFSARGYNCVRGFDKLDVAGREKLEKLYRWRFYKAKETNKAIFMVMTDSELLRLAQNDCKSLHSLCSILPRRKVSMYGTELLGLLKG
ncbi:MAG: ribonuclease D [Syntrophales bacterium]|nr:ribonuclease D [Syntrophales bacterium]